VSIRQEELPLPYYTVFSREQVTLDLRRRQAALQVILAAQKKGRPTNAKKGKKKPTGNSHIAR
jgi:hypothetical protein